MPLTDTAIKNARAQPKVTKLSDGGGLQLWIMPNGAKLCAWPIGSTGRKKLAIGPKGQKIVLRGRLLDSDSQLVDEALIEFWQANAAGILRTPASDRDPGLDPMFILLGDAQARHFGQPGGQGPSGEALYHWDIVIGGRNTAYFEA